MPGSRDFSLKAIGKRIAGEYRYFTAKDWSLKAVGDFWDSVTDYDDINESTYSYYRRFTNSWELLKGEFRSGGMIMLDIQARTGKGTDFWFGKGLIEKSYLVDFSDYLLSISRERLKNAAYPFELVKVTDFPLPFDDGFFDFVSSYETIEHMGNPPLFVGELTRVLKPGGILLITCPTVLWEPVHWLSAVLCVHHSEGPHRFPRRRKLLKLFAENKLRILKENTTVLLPFNKPRWIKLNELLERKLPSFLTRSIALRRTFVLTK